MTELYYIKKNMVKSASNVASIETVYDNQNPSTFEDLPLRNRKIELEAIKGDQLLITLTAPDTWNNTEGCGTWFGIEVNGTIVGKGVYFVAKDRQRVPITIQSVYEVEEDKVYTIKAKWATCAGGKSYIGAWSETMLTVLKIKGNKA